MSNTEIKHFVEIGYSVEFKVGHCYVDFKVYAHDGVCCDSGMPFFHAKDSPSYPDPVETTAEADVFASGDVKFDGCSNWNIDENARAMLHGCSRDDLLNIGKVLAECWDIAKERLPNFCG